MLLNDSKVIFKSIKTKNGREQAFYIYIHMRINNFFWKMESRWRQGIDGQGIGILNLETTQKILAATGPAGLEKFGT